MHVEEKQENRVSKNSFYSSFSLPTAFSLWPLFFCPITLAALLGPGRHSASCFSSFSSSQGLSSDMPKRPGIAGLLGMPKRLGIAGLLCMPTHPSEPPARARSRSGPRHQRTRALADTSHSPPGQSPHPTDSVVLAW